MVEDIKKEYAKKGYKFFETGDFNVNLSAKRSSDNITNKFDDVLTLAYKDGGKWIVKTYPVTVDPGYYYNENHLSKLGVAIIKGGQYKYAIGFHNGKPALVQAGPVTVYRDINRDRKIDRNKTETGWFGINIHRAGTNSVNVDKWSAGCTVFAKEKDFLEFMTIMEKSRSLYGNKFTYTVFE